MKFTRKGPPGGYRPHQYYDVLPPNPKAMRHGRAVTGYTLSHVVCVFRLYSLLRYYSPQQLQYPVPPEERAFVKKELCTVDFVISTNAKQNVCSISFSLPPSLAATKN
jgi:hypothetical protein